MTAPEKKVRLETDASIPAEVRERHLEEVRSRLEAGELDSDLALVETAFALLDGDLQPGQSA